MFFQIMLNNWTRANPVICFRNILYNNRISEYLFTHSVGFRLQLTFWAGNITLLKETSAQPCRFYYGQGSLATFDSKTDLPGQHSDKDEFGAVRRASKNYGGPLGPHFFKSKFFKLKFDVLVLI